MYAMQQQSASEPTGRFSTIPVAALRAHARFAGVRMRAQAPFRPARSVHFRENAVPRKRGSAKVYFSESSQNTFCENSFLRKCIFRESRFRENALPRKRASFRETRCRENTLPRKCTFPKVHKTHFAKMHSSRHCARILTEAELCKVNCILI